MLKKNELQILKLLFEDLTREPSIMDVSRLLKQKYVQTYKTIDNLVKAKIVTIKKSGKSKIIKLDFSKTHSDYILAEIERTNTLCRKNIAIAVIKTALQEVNKNFICVLFGSQTLKPKPKSDIDLLFVIPEEYDYKEFERIIHNKLIATNTDITIIPEKSLHEMWSNPLKLNISNELLKKHIILYGAEHFLNLLRKHYVG